MQENFQIVYERWDDAVLKPSPSATDGINGALRVPFLSAFNEEMTLHSCFNPSVIRDSCSLVLIN